MRDYALNAALSRDAAGGSIIGRLLRNFMARRSIATLSTYDDHLLRDIGICRADVEWAAELPLTVNAAVALEERAASCRRRRPVAA